MFSPSDKPRRDFRERLVHDADVNLLEVRHLALLGRAGHEHAAVAAEIDQRRRGNDERVLFLVHGERHLGIHPRLETEIRVGDIDLDLTRARRRIQHGSDMRDAPDELFARVGVYFHGGGEVLRDAPDVLFDDVGDEPDDADVHHRDERRVRRDPSTGVEHALGDEAADRRRDDGVGQVDLQLVEPRLRLRELRAGEVELRHGGLIARVGVVEGLLRNQLALVEVARAIQVRLREPQVGFALADRRRRRRRRTPSPA